MRELPRQMRDAAYRSLIRGLTGSI